MAKVLLSIFAAAALLSTARAQLLTAPQGRGYALQHKFNPEAIRKLGISEIRSELELKKDGDRIRKSHREWVYRFDREGRTVLIAQIDKQRRDTLISAYQYAGNRLECEVKNEVSGMISYCYTYDKQGRPLEKRFARTAPWRNKMSQQLGNAAAQVDAAAEIQLESFRHEAFDLQLHSTLHNSSGRPYRKDIRYYNPDGQMEKYLQSFVMTSTRHEELYSYNEAGLMSHLEVRRGKEPHLLSFEYDAQGSLLVEERHEDSELRYHKEYVYEGPENLLRAELLRRESEGLLEITTYSYSYWEP